MIGIYKITNKINGKIYIGQSTNIMSRWDKHCRQALNKEQEQEPLNLLHKAIRKYGVTNFYFEIEEVCDKDLLDQKEKEYIDFYNSLQPEGYNISLGGHQAHLVNESNPNAKMSTKDVYDIREDYKNLMKKSEVYEKYKDKISLNTFHDIWTGKTWINIHYDVYTEENKLLQRNNYDKFKAAQNFSSLSVEDIILIRNLKNLLHSRKEVYEQYFPNINFNVFNDVWYYRTFQYISPTVEAISGKRRRPQHLQDGVKNPAAIFTEDQIRDIRLQKKNGKIMKEVYLSKYQDLCKIDCFRNIWNEKTYKNIVI